MNCVTESSILECGDTLQHESLFLNERRAPDETVKCINFSILNILQWPIPDVMIYLNSRMLDV